MAETLRITKGQPFVLYVPLVILHADGTKEAVRASQISNVGVSLQSVYEPYTPEYHPCDRYLVLNLPATLGVGDYAVVIAASLPSGRPFTLRLKKAFTVVNWDFQSNWQDYIVGSHIELTDQPFIAGSFNPDGSWDDEGSDHYYLLTDEELDAIVADPEPEQDEEPTPESEEPQEENRPRIEAYNANLDVRVNLRRTNVDSGMATWEDEEQNVWYTDYPYALGDAVWNSNPATSQAWGVISLINE